MRQALLISILLLIPILALAQNAPSISKVEIAGVPEQTFRADLRDSIQKLVGQRYSTALVDPIVKRMETEHPDLVVATRNVVDSDPGQIRLVFVVAQKSTSNSASDANVNSQYIVESVEMKGLTRDQYSNALYEEMQSMVGQMLDTKKVEDLRAKLRSEPQLKGKYSVSDKIERGSQPEHVKLVFEATKLPWPLRRVLGSKIDISGGGISINDVKDTDIVESADVIGLPRSLISDTLYSDIQMMAGKLVDHLEIDHLKEKLEAELKNRYTVEEHITKGTNPNTARIVYKVKQIPWIPERNPFSIAAYHPKQGITIFPVGHIYKGFLFGAGSDGDTLTERFKGFITGLETQSLGTRHLGARLGFETFGILWKPQTLQALQSAPTIPGAYRRRQAIEPSVAFAFNRTLYATAGMSFTEMQMMLPVEHWESAHEAMASLRYKSPTLKRGTGTFEFTSGYEVRTGARNLNSDSVYTRHLWDGSYSEKSGKNTYKLSLLAGKITGNPPLFERFSMGNTTTLEGWNKYDIDPLGGTRVLHVSTEWSYRHAGVFLDNGAVWSAGQSITNRSSIGVNLGPLKLAVPLHCSTHCGLTFFIHVN